jgi:hypothetical protein
VAEFVGARLRGSSFRYEPFWHDEGSGARHAEAFRVRHQAFHDSRVQRDAVGKRGAAAGGVA